MNGATSPFHSRLHGLHSGFGFAVCRRSFLIRCRYYLIKYKEKAKRVYSLNNNQLIKCTVQQQNLKNKWSVYSMSRTLRYTVASKLDWFQTRVGLLVEKKGSRTDFQSLIRVAGSAILAQINVKTICL